MARPLPGLRRVEHDGGGEAGVGSARPSGAPRPSRRALTPVPLGQVEAPRVERLGTGIGEFDRVLGGGLVPGSLVLIGGAPGDRQVDDHRGGAGQPLGRGPARYALHLWRGVGGARSGCARSGWARRALRCPDRGRDGSGRRAGHAGGRAARGVRGRLGADAVRRRPHRRARLGVGQVREVAGRLMRAGQGARHRRRCSSAT